MSLREAKERAYDAGLDLVEVAPTAKPPVCKIMDYGRHKFEQNKAKKKQKNKNVEMKEIQVRPVIGEHDLFVKINTIKRFLEEGRVVQVTCMFSKRELAFKEQGSRVLEKITEEIKSAGSQEKAPAFNDKRLQVRFQPNKR